MKNERTHSSMPTQREMELFVQKRLDSKRMAEIQAMAAKSPLLKEALEGYAMYPVIPEFSAKAQNLIGSSQAAGAIATTVTVASPWWHLSGWILGLTVGGGSAFLIFSNKDEKKEQLPTTNTPAKEEVISQPSGLAEPEKTIEYPVVQDEKATAVTAPATDVKAEVSGTENISPIAISEIEEGYSEGTIDPIVPKEEGFNLILVREYADAEHPIVLNNKPDAEHPLVGKQQILHINNFKIVDYSSFRRDKWPSIDELTEHVGANHESEEAQTWMEGAEYAHAVGYMDYVEQGIYALSNQNYEEALSSFKSLLNLYPDDVNGLFYSGMCYYYLGQYAEARPYFEMAQRSSFRTFSEEGAFYEAMTFFETDQLEIAKGKLDIIAAQRGFYAKRSREILKMID